MYKNKYFCFIFIINVFLVLSYKAMAQKKKNNYHIVATAVANILPNTTLAPELKGTVIFVEYHNHDVFMTAHIEGIPNITGMDQIHAMHLHWQSNGMPTLCEPTSSDAFSKTNGHWNPLHQPHGLWEANSDTAHLMVHAGDIGNFIVHPNGSAYVEFNAGNHWCIGCGDPNKDIVGKAVIIHAGIDDYKIQPTGNSGAKLGCGLVEKK